MKMQHKSMTRFAGFPALVFCLAVIVTSCGNDSERLSGTSAAPLAATSLSMTVTVTLSGNQEVPPVATTGTGNAVLSVDAATGAISGTVAFSGLSSPALASHIHQAAAGVNGPIIIPLTGGVGLTSGTWTVIAGAVLTPAQLGALQAGGLYIQIHTLLFPDGEIRGQLVSS